MTKAEEVADMLYVPQIGDEVLVWGGLPRAIFTVVEIYPSFILLNAGPIRVTVSKSERLVPHRRKKP